MAPLLFALGVLFALKCVDTDEREEDTKLFWLEFAAMALCFVLSYAAKEV